MTKTLVAVISSIMILSSVGINGAGAEPPIPLPIKKAVDVKPKPKPQKQLALKDELAVLNDIKIPAAELKSLKLATNAIFKRKLSDAKLHIAKLQSPTAKKIAYWYKLRHSSILQPKEELSEFLKTNPAWPSRTRLNAKIERAILRSSMPAKEVRAHFAKQEPRSLAGMIAYGEAEIELGDKAKGQAAIRKAWTNPKLPSDLEKYLVKTHADTLRPEDHKIRVDRLLYLDRRSRIASAFRVTKYLDANSKKSATFRASVIRRASGTAKKLLAKLPKEVKAEPGVYLSRVQLARRTKNSKKAWKLLANSKFSPDQIHDKDEWWVERRVNARAAINEHAYESAYKITSNHENPSVNLYKQAEFMSGWIALRFLREPKKAKAHFLKFHKAADGPRSKSKAAYWLGRTYLKLNDKQKAEQYFNEGAGFYNTFYGQLSNQGMDKSAKNIDLPDPPKTTPDIARRFTDREEIKAIIIAHRADLNSIARIFFAHLRYHLVEPSELAMLAELAASLGYNQSTVRIGKTAMAQGFPLTDYAYPTRFLPDFKPLRKIPEKPVIYALARQESEFNETIVSRAGARGLLQVLPGTSRAVARRYKIKHHTKWLTSKPVFNTQIGSAYIGDRTDEFGGSYIMSFAGYNAGPGRVRQWVKKFGDPRSSHIDPIDWIERIPFTETRNYVQKVLANVQVYRARLGDGKSALNIYRDINRGKF